MNKTNFVQSGKIKYKEGKTTCSGKKGEYISLKKGKLKNSKEKLIKFAEQEIKEWQKFIKELKQK
uniref:Uncharacterized protein n=2 Tax=viral metagenome TaxID=1070528 RepID=A0A6M3LTL2_9ZZZZ